MIHGHPIVGTPFKGQKRDNPEFAKHQTNQMRARDPSTNCACGALLWPSNAYKCLYCDEYFCKTCAEEHFGPNEKENE